MRLVHTCTSSSSDPQTTSRRFPSTPSPVMSPSPPTATDDHPVHIASHTASRPGRPQARNPARPPGQGLSVCTEKYVMAMFALTHS